MKRAYILLLFMTVATTVIMAQSGVFPAGGTAQGAGGTVTYTVGQVADRQLNGSGNYVIEGVQQPYEIQTVGVNQYPGIMLEAILFPNPTANYVQLRITNYEIPADGLMAHLFDNNGKLLQIIKIVELETPIDLTKYPTASYQLRVMEGKRVLKTFKVIKNKF